MSPCMINPFTNRPVYYTLNNSSKIINFIIIYHFAFNTIKQVVKTSPIPVSWVLFVKPLSSHFRLYLILPTDCGFQISLNNCSKIINLIIIYHFTFYTIKIISKNQSNTCFLGPFFVKIRPFSRKGVLFANRTHFRTLG